MNVLLIGGVADGKTLTVTDSVQYLRIPHPEEISFPKDLEEATASTTKAMTYDEYNLVRLRENHLEHKVMFCSNHGKNVIDYLLKAHANRK